MLTYYPTYPTTDSTGGGDSTSLFDSTILYNNENPVEIDVGGIEVGQTFDDKTMKEM